MPLSGSGSSGSNGNQMERREPPKQALNPFEQEMMMLQDGQEQEMDALDSRATALLFFQGGKLLESI